MYTPCAILVILTIFWSAVQAKQELLAPVTNAADNVENNKPGFVGYGFALSDGYGVASAWFSNGTTINIAKIEGNQQYKEFMLGLEEIGFEEAAWSMTKCPPPPASCVQFYPPDEPESPLYGMINSLKSSVEYVVGHPISAVHVSFFHLPPLVTTKSNLQCLTRMALSRAGLERDTCSLHSGSQVAKRFSTHCEGINARGYTPRKSILTIEYTRRSATFTLWSELCGEFGWRNSVYGDVGGSEALDDCFARSDAQSCVSPVVGAIRRLFEAHSFDLTFNSTLDALAIYGEAADDLRLKNALAEVLLTTHSKQQVTDLVFMAEPFEHTFAASQVVAELDWSLKSVTAEFWTKDLRSEGVTEEQRLHFWERQKQAVSDPN